MKDKCCFSLVLQCEMKKVWRIPAATVRHHHTWICIFLFIQTQTHTYIVYIYANVCVWLLCCGGRFIILFNTDKRFFGLFNSATAWLCQICEGNRIRPWINVELVTVQESCLNTLYSDGYQWHSSHDFQCKRYCFKGALRHKQCRFLHSKQLNKIH